MRIHEVVLSDEVAGQLQVLLEAVPRAVLLGREFGGARIVTAVLPLPADEAGWEALEDLRHGPVGLAGQISDAEALERLLPGDILLQIHPEEKSGEVEEAGPWRARCLQWTGPADETVLRQVPVTLSEEGRGG